MAQGKQVIRGIDGFQQLVGVTIGPSEPVEVTQEKIEMFCKATDNTEWIHWDKERCKNSPFGTTIAPSWFTPSYFSKLFFDMVDIQDVSNMLLMGSDRVRLLSPLKCGTSFTMSVKVAKVMKRDKGIAVHYDATWEGIGQEKPIAVANIIIRYW